MLLKLLGSQQRGAKILKERFRIKRGLVRNGSFHHLTESEQAQIQTVLEFGTRELERGPVVSNRRSHAAVITAYDGRCVFKLEPVMLENREPLAVAQL